jgi:hypothetical protein
MRFANAAASCWLHETGSHQGGEPGCVESFTRANANGLRSRKRLLTAAPHRERGGRGFTWTRVSHRGISRAQAKPHGGSPSFRIRFGRIYLTRLRTPLVFAKWATKLLNPIPG